MAQVPRAVGDRPAEQNIERGEANEVVIQPNEQVNQANQGPPPPQAEPRVENAVSFSSWLPFFLSRFNRFVFVLKIRLFIAMPLFSPALA